MFALDNRTFITLPTQPRQQRINPHEEQTKISTPEPHQNLPSVGFKCPGARCSRRPPLPDKTKAAPQWQTPGGLSKGVSTGNTCLSRVKEGGALCLFPACGAKRHLLCHYLSLKSPRKRQSGRETSRECQCAVEAEDAPLVNPQPPTKVSR